MEDAAAVKDGSAGEAREPGRLVMQSTEQALIATVQSLCRSGAGVVVQRSWPERLYRLVSLSRPLDTVAGEL